MDQLKDYLQGLAWPNLSPLPTAARPIGNLVKFAQAQFARSELLTILVIQTDDRLPPDLLVWPKRCAIYVRLRDSLVRLGLQMEAAARVPGRPN